MRLTYTYINVSYNQGRRGSDMIFVIGSIFPENLDDYFSEMYYKSKPDVSSLVYGRKLLKGFKTLTAESELVVFSVPHVGLYPLQSKRNWVDFKTTDSIYRPIKYRSAFFLKHHSQFKYLKKALKTELATLPANLEVTFVVTEAYWPYLRAIKSLKNVRQKTRICVIVPDVPEFVGSPKRSLLLRLAKRVYVRQTYSLLDSVANSYILFSPAMAKNPHFGSKPHFVSLGSSEMRQTKVSARLPKRAVFIGKLEEMNCIKTILDAMGLIKDPGMELYIAGSGPLENKVSAAAQSDRRIHYLGFVNPDKAQSLLLSASCILCLRKPDDFSAYSFPSKLTSALEIDCPVISYELPTFDENLKKCVLIPKDQSPSSLAETISLAFKNTEINKEARNAFLKTVNNVELAKRIISNDFNC